jgi:mono/diheme cytochrome c family protein
MGRHICRQATGGVAPLRYHGCPEIDEPVMSDVSKRFCLPALLAVAVLAFTLAACGPREDPNEVLPEMTEERLAEGQQIFIRHCQSCHPDGARGAGPRLADRAIPVVIVRDRVRNGRRAMPAFGPQVISEDELESLVAYVVSLR